MDRSLFRRSFAVLAAAVSLLSWSGDALGYHPCPHHSGVPGAEHAHAGASDAAASEHAGAGGHAEHGAPGAPYPRPDADPDRDYPKDSAPAHDTDHGSCTCEGGCPSSPGAPEPVSSAAELRVAFTPDEPRAVPAVHRPSSLLDPFFLPYGQAPPLG